MTARGILRRGRRCGVIALAGAVLTLALADAAEDNPVSPANLAAYGWVSFVERDAPGQRHQAPFLANPTNVTPVTWRKETALQFEWQHPRPVRAVQLTFADDPPSPKAVRLEWWRRIWPDNGSGGWMKLDDPFNGQWTEARTQPELDGAVMTLRFAPLETTEAPGIKRTGFEFRHTYKLRLTCDHGARLTQAAAWSDAVRRRARLRFEWGTRTTVAGEWAPRFEARNGRILDVQKTGPDSAVVELEYADARDRLSPDRGHVVFRSGALRSFSVFVDDVLREGGLLVRDIGVFVSDADRNFAFKDWPGTRGDVWRTGTIAETVARLPEQSFERAMRALPAKPPRYCLLGLPNLRQEIALEPNGDIVLHADSLRSPGPDARASPWRRWDRLRYQFGTGEHPGTGPEDRRQVSRSLEAGWLPVVRHTWTDGELAWEQTSLAAPLVDELTSLHSETGTEPVVLATRFTVKNHATTARTAWLWLEINHPLPMQVGVDGLLVLLQSSAGANRPGFVPVRGRFETAGRGELELATLSAGEPDQHDPALQDSSAGREAVRYRVELAPGESHAVEFFVPYIELLGVQQVAALRELSFEPLHAAVTRFWRDRVAQGMTLETPESWLNDLFKANLWHVLISTDADPVTRQHQHGAATHGYKNFLNETMMVARSLEMRGERGAARRLIETFLANQGVKGLPGNFRTTDGVFYAAHPGEPDPYTAQGYNMHHGWGLAAAAEHYLWTRDRTWLGGIAPRLMAGADWITRERQATRFTLPDGSDPVEFGLPPAGDLEDVEEYLYWYATAGYYHLGLATSAEVLRSAAQSGLREDGSDASEAWRRIAREAERLERDAEAFRDDIAPSLAESVATSPVVRLKDGSWIPYVPPRAYALTHRKEGWIREALYPALHLINGRVLEPSHPYVDWMVQELEDNLFLSPESGYGVSDERGSFFDLGGFTLQPNLLDLALVYLLRDQPANFLRAFYNTAAASLYPDTMCFTEWVPTLGEGAGPLYKTPDECKFIQWLRQMLILERGPTLELGLGVPRAWMTDGRGVKVERAATHFGWLDLEIQPSIRTGQIRAVIRLVPTAHPEALRLRLRHPEGRPIGTATVNGRGARVNNARQLIELPARETAWEVVARFD